MRIDIPRLFVGLYAGSSILLYTFVSTHTPLAVLAIAPHDDGLYMSLGRFLAEGRWLGPFDQFTLMKGPGYPLFLAVNHWLGAPITLAHALFHCAAVMFFVVVAQKFIRSLLLSGILFTLLLWQPIAFAPELHRVIRDRIYFDQLLIVVAALAWALFGARDTRQRVLLATFAGAMLGWFWLTREEGVWVLPGLAVLIGAAAIQAYRERRIGKLAGTLLVLIGVFAAVHGAFRAVNWWDYGSFVGVDFKEANFQRALRALDSVRSGGTKRYVSITHAAMQRVNAVSPTFASTAPYFDGLGRGWERFGCEFNPSTCGEIAAGWFMWAMRDAAAYSGHFSSPAEMSTFFGRIADEVETACAKGQLECVPQLIAEMPPINSGQLAQGMAENYLRAVRLLLWPNLSEGFYPSNGSKVELDTLVRFLNYPLHTKSAALLPYTISGWYYRAGAEWIAFTMAHADGSVANAQLERKASDDIADHFHDDRATLQRYTINVDCNDQCVLQAQAPDGSRAAKTFAELANAPLSIAIGSGTLYVDRAASTDNAQYTPTLADRVAGYIRLSILRLYKYAFVPVLVLGALAFMASTLICWRGALGNVCYVMALMAWLLAVARTVLLLLISATSFPALLTGLYMAPAYFMLACGAVFSCAAWLQLRDERLSPAFIARDGLTG